MITGDRIRFVSSTNNIQPSHASKCTSYVLTVFINNQQTEDRTSSQIRLIILRKKSELPLLIKTSDQLLSVVTWLVGFVNEVQVFLCKNASHGSYFHSINGRDCSNSDHDHLICVPWVPRVKCTELHTFYSANNVDQFPLQIVTAPSSQY